MRDLHTAGVPHLPVRVRDGAGLVGPLVIPGVTSCLACADLHRTDRDAAWPAVAAQLRDVIGTADRPTVLATAALALGQLQRIITAVRGTGGRRRAAGHAEHHPGGRRRAATPSGPSLVTASALPMLTSMVARTATSGMMGTWQTSSAGAPPATPSWPAFRSALRAGPRWASASD